MSILSWWRKFRAETAAREVINPRCAACDRPFVDGEEVDVNDSAGDGSAFCHNGRCICMYVFKMPNADVIVANTRTYRSAGSVTGTTRPA